MSPEVGTSTPPRAEHDGPLQPGTRFGKFDVKKRIGRGGYASVYHAFDTILHRDVAIKVLHRAGGVTDDMLRRGVVEAQLMCQLQHKNIVQVYDANITEAGLLYLVMELLVGQTLWQVLRRYERLAVEEACSIGIQIADAVEAAHQQGAIHRDLKPENVFVTKDNLVKVLDFGIAKVVHGAQGHTTRPDAIQGTVLYMSPEQIAGHKVTGRSDIYALGNMLFEMLYGKSPCLLQNPHADTMAIAWMQTYDVPPALESIAPYCPRHVSRIVAQSMSKQANDRQSSMRELKEALEASRSRFIDESGGGELKGEVRDLSGAPAASGNGGFERQSGGKFPWFSRSAPVAPDTEPQDELPASVRPEAATAVGIGLAIAPTPATDPSPISLQALPRSQSTALDFARKNRTAFRVMGAFWALSILSGIGVSVGLTKWYLHHKRQSSSVQLRSEPTAAFATPALPVAVESPSVQVTLSASVTSSTLPPADPRPSAASSASAAPLATRPKPTAQGTAKPRKLAPSEARLKALEEQINNGTLRLSPAK